MKRFKRFAEGMMAGGLGARYAKIAGHHYDTKAERIQKAEEESGVKKKPVIDVRDRKYFRKPRIRKHENS